MKGLDKKASSEEFEMIKRHKVVIFVSVFLVILGIVAVAGGNKKNSQPVTSTQTSASSQSAKPTPRPQSIFDVPSLVGKNIDQIREVLGTPADGAQTEPTAEQKKLGVSEWNNTFKKDNKELLVTYNSDTRKIIDFFISADDTYDKNKDKNHLLELGNLSENSSTYTIEFVKEIKNPSNYTGVKATPK